MNESAILDVFNAAFPVPVLPEAPTVAIICTGGAVLACVVIAAYLIGSLVGWSTNENWGQEALSTKRGMLMAAGAVLIVALLGFYGFPREKRYETAFAAHHRATAFLDETLKPVAHILADSEHWTWSERLIPIDVIYDRPAERLVRLEIPSHSQPKTFLGKTSTVAVAGEWVDISWDDFQRIVSAMERSGDAKLAAKLSTFTVAKN